MNQNRAPKSRTRQKSAARQTGVGEHLESASIVSPGRNSRFSQPDIRSTLVTFPTNGGLVALLPGRTQIDLLGNSVRQPDGQSVGLNIPRQLQNLFMSAYVFVDTEALIAVNPSQGVFTQQGGSTFLFAGVTIRSLSILLDKGRPGRGQFIFTAQPEIDPVVPILHSEPQVRWSSIAVTTTDDFVGIKVIPVVPAGDISISQFGAVQVNSNGYGQKTFLVNNTGSNAIRARIVGRMRDVDDASEYVDVEATDPQTGFVIIPSGEYKIIETGLPWHTVECQVRSDTAGASSTVTLEYKAVMPLLRGA